MQSIFRKVTGAAKIVGLSLLISGVLGCAVSPGERLSGEDATPSTSQSRLLQAEIGRFIEDAATGAVLLVASSPWGDEVEITTAALYDAASGRQCRDLSVQSQHIAAMPAIVCRIHSGQWESVRPITRGAGL